MIKKYGQFVNENQEPVVPTKSESELDDNMVCVQISQDEENLFGSESILQNLVSSGRITYKSGELCYPKDDEDVSDIVKSYFTSSIKESINEVRHNEFDEEYDDTNDERSVDGNVVEPHSYHIRRDTKLAQDAFQAGVDYTNACESPNSHECENAMDFETWWSSYKK